MPLPLPLSLYISSYLASFRRKGRGRGQEENGYFIYLWKEEWAGREAHFVKEKEEGADYTSLLLPASSLLPHAMPLPLPLLCTALFSGPHAWLHTHCFLPHASLRLSSLCTCCLPHGLGRHGKAKRAHTHSLAHAASPRLTPYTPHALSPCAYHCLSSSLRCSPACLCLPFPHLFIFLHLFYLFLFLSPCSYISLGGENRRREGRQEGGGEELPLSCQHVISLTAETACRLLMKKRRGEDTMPLSALFVKEGRKEGLHCSH